MVYCTQALLGSLLWFRSQATQLMKDKGEGRMPTFATIDELYRVIGQFIEMGSQSQSMGSLKERWGGSPEFEENEEPQVPTLRGPPPPTKYKI